MDVLADDVLCHVLSLYLRAHHLPLVQQACLKWQRCAYRIANKKNNVMLYVGRNLRLEFHSSSAVRIAADGNGQLLAWIRQRRGPLRDWTLEMRKVMAELAARRGHVCILELLDWQQSESSELVCSAVYAAARGGRVDIVQSCLTWFNRKVSDVFVCHVTSALFSFAARGGHESLVKHLFQRYDCWDMDVVALNAARGGHEHLLRWALGMGADANMAMRQAASTGHVELVRMCYEEVHARDIHAAMCAAMANGHTAVVDLCVNAWGAKEARVVRTQHNGAAGDQYMDDEEELSHSLVSMYAVWEREAQRSRVWGVDTQDFTSLSHRNMEIVSFAHLGF